MPTCPNRHESQWSDYCGVCGARMTEAAPIRPAAPSKPTQPITSTEPAGSAAPASCPDCGEVREDRFCEQCGYDFVVGQPSTPPRWIAVLTCDRAYFEAGGAAAAQFTFPARCPERRIVLSGHRIRIGRRSRSRAIMPEIDLSCEPEDEAVSREHAQLLAQPDGSWSLVDKGSANGTYVNGNPEPIPRDLLVPLADGDVIRLGIWTMITLRREP